MITNCFDKHVTKLCQKAGQKLHALARISNFMSLEKRKLLMNSFISSQFSYCPLIWMFCSRRINRKINHIHERALRLVYDNYTTSFDDLLKKDNTVSIHHRNIHYVAIEMYKVCKYIGKLNNCIL